MNTSSPCRLGGILVLLGALVGFGRGEGLAATSSPDALPAIPTELQYTRVPLAEEENAVTDWLKAVAALTPLDEPGKTRVRVAWTPGAKPLPPEDWAPITVWLKKSAEGLQVVQDGLQKRKAQWPTRRPEDFEPGLTVIRLAATGRLAAAYDFGQRGEPAKAVDLILGTVKLGQMAADGEGALIHYFVGHACRSLGHQAAQRFATQSRPPAAELRRLLDGLPSLDDEPEVYARILRVEFTYYAIKPVDAVKMAGQWTDGLRESPETMNLLLPEELRRPHAVFMTPSLVAGHPRPYDHAAAVRQSIPTYQRFLRSARAAWTEQEEAPDDPAETLTTFLEDAEGVLNAVEDEPLPLSREAADRARAAYNAFENPVGRLLEARPDVVDFSTRRVFQARVEREATRALIALRLHQLERGNWPVRLDELVEAWILPALPRDAFSGGTLRYDRARLVIWSVGADGEDDGGTSPVEGRWQQDDAVWKVASEE